MAAQIAKQYSVSLRDPKVVVKILDRSNRAVAFLSGAVRFSQRFQIKRPVFLNELLITSGGITDNASGEIRIFRPQNLTCGKRKSESDGSGEDPQNFIIKISDLLAGIAKANPQIYSGDLITVEEAFPVYLIGGVKNPKPVPLRSRMTLTRAIASAGGLAEDGLESKVTIFRREGAERRIIEFNLQKIRTNQVEDPTLQAFDIVEIGQKGKPPKKLPPRGETRTADRDKFSKLPLRIID